MRYHFGDRTLDLGTRRLVIDGDREVHLEPRTFAVLAHLVTNRDRVVTKEELLDEVWGDRFVTHSALTTRVKHLRRATGDDGSGQQVIRTVHRVGYQFVADVEESPGPGLSPGGEPKGVRSPRPVSPVFGRDHDLDALVDRVAQHRLVTVTGLGGVGKTTLARAAVASGRLGALAGWCDLATTPDESAVATVVLQGVGEGQQADAGVVESLLRALEPRAGLLVLDDCEQVVGAVRVLAGNILRRCPEVRLLATSRVPLGGAGESVLPLGPLSDADAVACFLDRCRDAGSVVDADDQALRKLCRRLDGIPLALELAAARSRLLSPGRLLRLLGDRFRLLADAAASDDGRHTSLRAVVAWSWDQLRPCDRALLATLTVLVGPFTFADAAAVGGRSDELDTADGLDALVRASLLTTADAAVSEPTFRMLEAIREMAAGDLSDGAAPRRRHAGHFADVAEQLDCAMQTESIDEALEAMSASWDNIRAAVRYAHQHGDVVTVRRIVRAVSSYADLRQVYEVLEWCDLAGTGEAPQEHDDEGLAADVLAVRARLLAHQGRHERAAELAQEALAARESRTTLLTGIWCDYYRGDLDRVLAAAERLGQLSRSSQGMDRGFAEGFSAVVAAVRQVPGTGERRVAPQRAREGVLGALDCLVAGFRLSAAEPGVAAELLEAVLDESLRKDYRLLLGAAGSTLVQIALPAQPPETAMRTMKRTLITYRDRGMWTLISADLVMAAKLLADAGDGTTAARLLGARAASGYRTGLSEVLRASLESDLAGPDREGFDRLAAEGARWRPPEAADVAVRAMEHHLDRARR